MTLFFNVPKFKRRFWPLSEESFGAWVKREFRCNNSFYKIIEKIENSPERAVLAELLFGQIFKIGFSENPFDISFKLVFYNRIVHNFRF